MVAASPSPADEEVYLAGSGGQENRGLPRRVSACHHHHLIAHAEDGTST